MSEAYETRMDSIAVKICWISVQCYEMVLPGGKTLVTDPFYWDMSHFDGLTEDELPKNQKLEKKVYAQSGFSVDQFPGADCGIVFMEECWFQRIVRKK